MASRKDTLQLIRWAEDRGWSATLTKGGHVKLTKPGHDTVTVAGTPSDHRAMLNEKARIKRAERKVEEAAKAGGAP